jgi:hypothetical protein
VIRQRRNKRGSIAELGPALFILIIVILVPLMALICVGLGFACGWYLNFMSVRAAAVCAKNDMPAACTAMEAAWGNSGLPAFTGASVVSNSAVRFDTMPNTLPDGRTVPNVDDLVVCTTVVTINPFVSVPFIPIGPMTFTYKGERPVEEKSNVASGPQP